MKKYILSTLCSALVVPGLGQVINNNLKKGVSILAIVFVIVVIGTIKLALVIDTLFEGMSFNNFDTKVFIEKTQDQDYFILWVLLIVFGIVWIYSVLDAFLTGKKIENRQGDVS